MFHWTEYTRDIRNILFPQDFDKHEMLVYEEVARMPPFHRKTLVLVGKIVDKIINNINFHVLLRKKQCGGGPLLFYQCPSGSFRTLCQMWVEFVSALVGISNPSFLCRSY